MSYKPRIVFDGEVGNPSSDNAGPETLQSDLKTLARMFDPNSTHVDGSQGGISYENLNFNFNDGSMSEKIGSADIDGLTASPNVYSQLVAIVQILTSRSNLAAEDTLKLIGGLLNGEASNGQAIIDNLYNLVIDRYTKEQSDANLRTRTDTLIESLDYDPDSGVLLATYGDGSSYQVFDLNVEKIPASISLVEEDDVTYIRITNSDGTYTQSDVSNFFVPYEFASTSTVSASVTKGADKSTVSISVKDGSISRAKLDAEVLEAVTEAERNAGLSADSARASAEASASSAEYSASKASTAMTMAEAAKAYQDAAESFSRDAGSYETLAEKQAGYAQTYANNASGSATTSKSWAVGGTSTRTGENTNNSKYYAEQASASKTSAEASATQASAYATNASNAASNASSSAILASNHATSAENYAEETSGYIDTAKGYRDEAKTYRDTAKTYSDNANIYMGNSLAYSNSAKASADSVGGVVTEASDYAKNSKSWAVGGTSSRTGENTDNAKYYSEQAKLYAEEAEQIAGGDFVTHAEYNEDMEAVENSIAALGNNTVNGKKISTNPTLSASDVGAVPTSRTVNGKALSSNITLSASDVSARANTWMPSASDVGAVAKTDFTTEDGKLKSLNLNGTNYEFASSGGGTFVINATYSSSEGFETPDKTVQEVIEALDSNMSVILCVNNDEFLSLQYYSYEHPNYVAMTFGVIYQFGTLLVDITYRNNTVEIVSVQSPADTIHFGAKVNTTIPNSLKADSYEIEFTEEEDVSGDFVIVYDNATETIDKTFQEIKDAILAKHSIYLIWGEYYYGYYYQAYSAIAGGSYAELSFSSVEVYESGDDSIKNRVLGINLYCDEDGNVELSDVIEYKISDEIDDLKKSVSDGKSGIASAITSKGVTTSADATFETMANNILAIATGGSGGSDIVAKINVESLSVARDNLAATTVGSYALFGGGGNAFATVDAYNDSLTRSTPTELSVGRKQLAATTVGSYALFGGGGQSANCKSTVDAYNDSLTQSTPTALSVGRKQLAATTVGSYALFGGGYVDGYSSVVDAYNDSLTRSTPTELSVGRGYLAATTIGSYALFGGGSGSDSSTVNAYNSSLTRSTPTELSVGRYALAATTIGSYALFGGGTTSENKYATVDAYNSSLTRSTPTELSVGRGYLAATTVGSYALFGGGYDGNNQSSVVDVYNSSLIRSTPTALSTGRGYLAATTVGSYALFGGGYDAGYDSTVDAYVVSVA